VETIVQVGIKWQIIREDCRIDIFLVIDPVQGHDVIASYNGNHKAECHDERTQIAFAPPPGHAANPCKGKLACRDSMMCQSCLTGCKQAIGNGFVQIAQGAVQMMAYELAESAFVDV